MRPAEIIGNAVLYLGDCRDIMPRLDGIDTIITDPPWDAAKNIPGSDDPRGLFNAAAHLFKARRYVIQLGCDSDPSFLAAMSDMGHPFLRTCWLEYACPTYKGRLLHTGDVAYAYGEWPPAEKGKAVIPGRCISSKSDKEFRRGVRPKNKEKGGFSALEHPMPRRLEHVLWLVKWFARGRTLDPFMGSGTTGVACAMAGLPFRGIEIEPRFFDLACRRIDDAHRQARLIA
jgi:site-specific DNA-methyltransferase (adenine-specific)